MDYFFVLKLISFKYQQYKLHILLAAFTCILFTSKSLAQTKVDYIVEPEKPIVLINDLVISDYASFLKIPKDSILEMNIIKGKKLNSKNIFFDKNTNESILVLKANGTFKIRTQKELNNFFGLPENRNIYVNGYLINNKNYSFLISSIKSIDLLKPNSITLKETSLNVTIN